MSAAALPAFSAMLRAALLTTALGSQRRGGSLAVACIG
jgi:hypothetical protein